MAGVPVELSLGPEAGGVPRRTLDLESADLRQVLSIYQKISDHTVIASPSLHPIRVDLRSGPELSRVEAIRLLQDVFRAKGLCLRMHGERFLSLAPAAQSNLLETIPALPPASAGGPSKRLPAGQLRFTEADMERVLMVYGSLMDREILVAPIERADRFGVLRPFYPSITIYTQTVSTYDEAAWLLEAAFHLQGIALVPVRDKFVVVLPAARLGGVPMAASDLAVAPKNQTQPAVLELTDALAAVLLQKYAELVGRRPMPLAPTFPQVKVSFCSRNKLEPAESLFALETLAALNHWRFEAAGADGVNLVISAFRAPPKTD